MRKLLTIALILSFPITGSTQEQSPLFQLLSPTANSGGKYNNPIPNIALSQGYTEVCIKDGQVLNDQHPSGGPTFGGDCLPGDTGWILERNQRTAEFWEDARIECLKDGLRLPEVFEFVISCKSANDFGLLDMVGEYEFASNEAVPFQFEGDAEPVNAIAITTAGSNDCTDVNLSAVLRNTGSRNARPYRCGL